jgi:hypothetical protein
MPEPSVPQAAAVQPGMGCLLRLFWMSAGNVALLFAAVKVSESERVGVADAAYMGVVLALLAARYVDITKFNGMTAKAEPATRAHLLRYSIGLSVVAVAIWVVARVFGSLGS